MGTSLRLHQVRVCATPNEDKSSAGIVLNVDRTGGGKSHTMLLSCPYDGGKWMIMLFTLMSTVLTNGLCGRSLLKLGRYGIPDKPWQTKFVRREQEWPDISMQQSTNGIIRLK